MSDYQLAPAEKPSFIKRISNALSSKAEPQLAPSSAYGGGIVPALNDLELVILFDTSSSMGYGVLNTARDGVQKIVRSYATSPRRVFVTFATFDTDCKIHEAHCPYPRMRQICDDRKYLDSITIANGSDTRTTAAVGYLISEVEKFAGAASQVVFILITDGDEAYIEEYLRAPVRQLVLDKRHQGWSFSCFAIGVDLTKQCERLGFNDDLVINVSRDEKSVEVAFDRLVDLPALGAGPGAA